MKLKREKERKEESKRRSLLPNVDTAAAASCLGGQEAVEEIVDQSRAGNFGSCSWKMSKRKCLSIKEKRWCADFLSLDFEAKTSETLTELDILDSMKNKNTAMNCDEDDAEINKPSYDEMLKSFETTRC
ncbi:hypothetical protein AVEN_154891-1 [Araneus ventricosus]|uniref:Uncharacterized protein n=1 Tax=Araneus ventricosus TaxID=182803 RepID=A0A4Y2A6U9_ARAVE|nr:hypothetical protein AVEN_154891-1 [Araneus ventricosus]